MLIEHVRKHKLIVNDSSDDESEQALSINITNNT